MIRVWQSYSCNNSGASRLVARFVDEARARAIGDELRDLLASLAGTTRRTSALQAMAQLYGFDDYYDYGSYGPDEGPFVIVDERTLIVFLEYGLGIGPGVPAYLEEQGAEVEDERGAFVHASVLFRAPLAIDPQLDAELAAFAAQPVDEDRVVQKLAAPWVHERARGRLAHFRDAGSAGLFFPIDPRDLVHLRAWLADRGIDKPVVAIEAYADQDLFAALATARCTACDGPLEYLDPRLHDIESPQLVCKPCGGLYELAAFLPEMT